MTCPTHACLHCPGAGTGPEAHEPPAHCRAAVTAWEPTLPLWRTLDHTAAGRVVLTVLQGCWAGRQAAAGGSLRPRLPCTVPKAAASIALACSTFEHEAHELELAACSLA